MKNFAFASLLFVAGCASAPSTAETEREVVLQYVAVDAGTAGPFSRKSKQELDILSDQDRLAATALLDRGAVAFVVYHKNQMPGAASPATRHPGTRIVLVQHGRVVGDFKAP